MTQIHPLVSKQNQSKLVELLKDARYTVGLHRMQSLLPEHFVMSLDAHDTGCQPRIVLNAEGRGLLLVWQGSIWYASGLGFNDRNKVLGINPECLFAQDLLVRYFETLHSLHTEVLASRSLQKAENSAKQTEKHQSDVEFYKALLSPKTVT